jgi:hypothetical protein
MLNPQFGSGVLTAIPNAGNLAANPTPMQFGLLQEVQIEIKGDTKELYDNLQIPAAIARGKIKVTGKGKMASLDPMFFSQLYFGLPTTAGVLRPVYNELRTAAASITTNNAAATADLGVIATGGTGFSVGTQLTNSGTAAPSSGQYKFTAWTGTSPGAWQAEHTYALNATILDPAGHTQKVTTAGTSGAALPTFNDSLSTTTDGTVVWTDQGLSGTAGTYTFNAADVTAGLTVALNYVWDDVDHGVTLAIPAQLEGYAPQFTVVLYNNFKGQLFGIQLNACVLGGCSIPTKQEDFWVADFDFSCGRDASNNLGSIFADQI